MRGLQVIENQGQRVLTTKQLAMSYGATETNIKQNFNNHKERFIEGKHYYCLVGEALRELKSKVDNIDFVAKNVNKLYLWTEKGALRHAKILDTEKAWEVYERLEETYFRVKENQLDMNQLSPELQMFNNLFKALVKTQLEQKYLQEEITTVKEEVAVATETLQTVKDTIIKKDDDWRVWARKKIKEIGAKLGDYRRAWNESYQELERRARCNLDRRLENIISRAVQAGEKKANINKLSYLDVIERDIKLKEIYISVVKELSIKYMN